MILTAKMRCIQLTGEPDWLVDLPLLNASTQGRTKEEAVDMLKDLLLTLVDSYVEESRKELISISVFEEKGSDRLRITCQPWQYLYLLALRRQRIGRG